MIKAVIFDMDGVLIDSEGLWSIAEEEVFSSLGVTLDSQSCNLTKAMTTREVTEFWFSKYPWKTKTINEVEEMVISRVIALIKTNNCEIDGIKALVKKIKQLGYKVGLATNAPYRVVPEVLSSLGLTHSFDSTTSAEFEKHGKPHLDVYLTAAKQLGVTAENCIAIEDSTSGIKAAKEAGMTVIGFTNNRKNTALNGADYIVDSYANLDWDVFKDH